MRDILTFCTQQDFAVTGVQVKRVGERGRDRRDKLSGKGRARDAGDAFGASFEPSDDSTASKGTVTVVLELRGARSVTKLVDKLSQIDGVSAVQVCEVCLISD